MSGSQYIALSGLRARIDELDRLAADISNVGTAGYKGEREARAVAPRETFDATLQTAIDTTFGGRRLDMTSGSIATTGRELDVAVEGKGFFAISTPGGTRYTRNGHFALNAERQLVTADGALVQGADGAPITLGSGDVRIDQDGSVWAGTAQAGRIGVFEFADPRGLVMESASRLRAEGQTATPAATPLVRPGSLEQSNVSVAARLAELTTVSRGFEALQRAISTVMNDVDGRAIEHLGRRG
ncbi:MAG: flagellar hook basal-body protein [Acidobacteria bacterium]|nr:flagellar hook basal-body protein [Acidobacteriota bacterium]